MCHGPVQSSQHSKMAASVLGFSLRFPESNAPSIFWDNLANGVDMQTSENCRWPQGLHDIPPRTGKISGLDLFDNAFFNVHGKQAQRMDPQQRKLLEAGYEAWIDSGVDFNSLRGSSKVGVYIGACGSDAHGMWLGEMSKISGYEQTGCAGSMFANRLSWFFDFRGPSKVIDTACSSSMVALHDAVTDLAMGRIDYAMVGGGQTVLSPAVSLAFNRLQMLSPEAACKSFDASGNGYARADGVSVNPTNTNKVIILCRTGLDFVPSWTGRGPIATIVGIASNNDGYTKESITFPSSDAQTQLARKVCKESGIHPSEIVYVEAHGTGTVAGDAQELASIDAVYGSGDAKRTPDGPLLIGSVKSNMGHCEGGSGLAAVIKVLLAFENDLLPPNLHYGAPNPKCSSLHDGTLKVVTRKTPFLGGTVAINNFGFGGTNVHMLIQKHADFAAPTFLSNHTQQPAGCGIVPLASRTKDGLMNLAEKLKQLPDGHLTLLNPLTRLAETIVGNTMSYPYRGAILPDGDFRWKQTSRSGSTPVWFAFSGNGSQWAGMAGDLYNESRTFKGSVDSCATALKLRYDFEMLQHFGAEQGWGDPVSAAVGLTAIQVGLVDMLEKELGIRPAGIIAHSSGEIAAGYADGVLSREQTIWIAYERASKAVASSPKDGLMAAVGMSAQEADAFLQEHGSSVVVACENSPTNVTLSGRKMDVEDILEKLKAKEVFVREVNTRGIAYHTPYLDEGIPELKAALEAIVPKPNERSKTWISSTFPSDSSDTAAAVAGAEYHVHGFRHRVLFKQACSQVPKDVIVLEIGPHSILKSLIRQCRSDVEYLPTLIKGENGVSNVHAAAAALWNSGATVAWPVSDEPGGIQVPRVIREAVTAWDHRTQYPLPSVPDITRGMFTVTYDLSGQHSYLVDHNIDGRILMPATSYLLSAWEALAVHKQKPTKDLPVVFEDVQIYQAVQADVQVPVTFKVSLDHSNRFQVVHDWDLIAEGRIKAMTPEKADQVTLRDSKDTGKGSEPSNQVIDWENKEGETISKENFYGDVGRTGIHYGPSFQMVEKASCDGKKAVLSCKNGYVWSRWDDCFIRFLDGCLQVTALGFDDYCLRIPTRIRYVAILNPSPSFTRGSEVLVEIDKTCNTSRSELTEIAGIELSLAPKKQSALVTEVTRVEWVPYGDRVVDNPVREELHEAMLGIYRHDLVPLLQDLDGEGCLKPHLRKVMDIGLNLSAENPSDALRDRILSNPCNVMARILHDQTKDIDALKKVLEDPIRSLVEHPDYARLYLDDAIYGTAGLELKMAVDLIVENMPPDGYNVLEIGAGTGGLTKQMASLLQSTLQIAPLHSYVATDISPAFGPNLLSAVHLERLDFKVWDINKAAPKDIGGPFNLITASNAVHTCNNLAVTLNHVYDVLADDGFVLFYEYTGAITNALWGLSEECWKFNDAREFGLWTTLDHWKDLMTAAGFACVMIARPAGDSGAMMVYRKVKKDKPSHRVLFPGPKLDSTNAEIEDWLKQYNSLLPEAAKIQEQLASGGHSGGDKQTHDGLAEEETLLEKAESETAKIWLYGDLKTSPGLPGLSHSVRLEPGGTRLRTVFNMSGSMDAPEDVVAQCEELDLVLNVFRDGVNGSIRSYPIPADTLGSVSSMDGGQRGAHLDFKEIGNIASGFWIENLHVPAGASSASVVYSALNFKDAMLAFGKLPRDLMYDSTIGFEFAGQLEEPMRIGQHIYPAGQRIAGSAKYCLGTKVAVLPHKVHPISSSWSYAEAATTPVAYSTAYYALIMQGRMEPGQTVLIHSGAGAVGLAAIRICLCRGCEVYTTCSSNAKRDFLLGAFPELKPENIGDSRSCAFEATVMRGTRGRGVDFCLNSLDQEKLKASVRCLATDGTLLEIGKFDMVVGTTLPMRAMLRGVKYVSVLLDQVLKDTPSGVPSAKALELNAIVNEGIANGEVIPLPFKIYQRDEIQAAFRFLTRGVHIGKVLVQMASKLHEEPSSSNIMRPYQGWTVDELHLDDLPNTAIVATQSPEPLMVRPSWTCRSGSTYIITGGLGGFGMALAEWLIQKGAKNLVLTSTRGVQTGRQRIAIERMQAAAVNVVVSTLDVSIAQQAKELIEMTGHIAPIAGIFHLAMRLHDHLLTKQTGEGWNDCVKPKAIGAYNLDLESRRLQTPLDVFVIFSSAIVEMGNPGQANYGFANFVVNEICEARKAAGVPGQSMSIQWGPIDNVGFFVRKDKARFVNLFDNLKVQLQPIDNCLEQLGYLLAGGDSTPAVVGVRAYELKEGKAEDGQQDLISSILSILGVKEGDVGEDDDLTQLGIDSMQVVEVRATLQKSLGRAIPLDEIGTLTLARLRALAGASPGGKSNAHSSISNESPLDQNAEGQSNQVDMNAAAAAAAAADELEDLLKGAANE